MSDQKNAHGLTRDIPPDVSRRVRQDCGFACVVCGGLGKQYDHFDPEFKDCTAHRAEGIALVCGTCHDEKRMTISSERIGKFRQKRLKERQEAARYRPRFAGGTVAVRIGSNNLQGKEVRLTFGGRLLLQIEGSTDEDELAPWTLSGTLVHGNGVIAKFERNEILVSSDNWDVEVAGPLLTFRRRKGSIALQLRFQPDSIAIVRLHLIWPSGLELIVNADGDIEMLNLGFTPRVVIRGCQIVGQGSHNTAASSFKAIQIAPGARIGNIEISKTSVNISHGTVDLGQLISFELPDSLFALS